MVKIYLCLAFVSLLRPAPAQVTLLSIKNTQAAPSHLAEWVVLQNTGTGKFLSTSLSGDHENSTLVQHGRRPLPVKAFNTSGIVKLSTESGNMVGVSGANLKERCPVALLRHDTSGTRWIIKPQGSSTFVLQNVDTRKVLAVKDGSIDDHAELIQENQDGSKRQIWKAVKASEEAGD